MTRSFDGTSIDPDWLDQRCEDALFAPTAGNTAGVSMYTITGDDVARYFAVATDEHWRTTAQRAPGLLRAGGVVVVTSHPTRYLERYQEEDKRSSGLARASAWTIPYWHTDAGMATMALLLLLEESDLDATLWGNFRHDREVLAFLGASSDEELFASVLIGRGDGRDYPSSSLQRAVAPRRDRVHRVRRT